MPTREEIGKRLKELRESLSIPRKAVCSAVGITDSALSMYESGERVPRDEIKVKFSALFGKTVQEIFFD